MLDHKEELRAPNAYPTSLLFQVKFSGCSLRVLDAPQALPPEVLKSRQLLVDMLPDAKWWALPLHEWPVLLCSTDVESAAAHSASKTKKSLAEAWEQRHVGVPSQAKNTAVGKVSSNPCRLGICICKIHTHVKQVLTRLGAFLKALPPESLAKGDVVLIWQGFLVEDPLIIAQELPRRVRGKRKFAGECGDVLNEVKRVGHGIPSSCFYTHIPLCKLRPFSPTLLQLVKLEMVADGAWFEIACDTVGNPQLYTTYEFLSNMVSPDLAWDVEALLLSDTRAVMSSLRGVVHAVRVEAPTPSRLWCADWEFKRKPRAQRRAPPAEANNNQAAQDIAQQPLARNMLEELGLDPQDEEESLEADVGEPDEDLLDELVEAAMWQEEVIAAGQEAGALQHGHNSGVDIAMPGRERPRSPSSSSSSSSSTSSNSARPSAERSEPAEVVRVVQHDTHMWGPFRLTWRASTPTQKSSWQATCRFHADYEGSSIKTRCTRSMAAPNGPASADGQVALRSLKAWLLAGSQFQSKSAHQSMRNEALKSEDTLSAELEALGPVPEKPWGEGLEPNNRARVRRGS